jgi:hypothetical protein
LLLSLHDVPVSGAFTQPRADAEGDVGSQLSIVHGLLSLQSRTVARHAPPEHLPAVGWQTSDSMHEMPSLFWQLPVALHAWHALHALIEQQKPLVQNAPVTHSSPELHWAPSGFLPQVVPTHVLGAAHCVLSVQVTRHAVPEQTNGPHWCVPPPTLQLPAPSHVFASVPIEVLAHDGATHCVPGCHLWHQPAPSHVPSLPHVEAAVTPHWPVVSSAPGRRGEQVPRVMLSVHETHGPEQVMLQHTPCAEHTRPVAHWLLDEHGPPLGSRPHEPLMQVALLAQSALDVQVDLQTAAPQANGKHEVALGVTHFPAPSQDDWPVNMMPVAGHVGSAHFVLAAYFWHAPAAQRPFVPQLAAPWSRHMPFGSTMFVGTFVHWPSVPVRPHDLQAAVQVVAQQKPWAHTPVAHSVAAEHGAPLSFLPHELPLHTLGVEQFAVTVQASKHLVPLQAYGTHERAVGATHCPVLLHVGGPV